MFDLGKRYDKAVEWAAEKGRRAVDASKSPEPFYVFASPSRVVGHLNAVNNMLDVENYFAMNNFQGRLRIVGNAIDWMDAKMGIERGGGRGGSYLIERVGLEGDEREVVGRVRVSTNYTHFRGVEERFENIKLELEKPVKLIYEDTPVIVSPGLIGLTMTGEEEYPPRIEREEGIDISAVKRLGSNVPTIEQMFPNDIFLKEEWKARKK